MVWRFAFSLLLFIVACQRPPATATTSGADGRLRAPDGSEPGAGPLGASIRRGHAILIATRDSLPTHVGSSLRCTSCHLRDGRDSMALPLTGVYARFPQYRARSGLVQRLEDRINDCLLRSLNGAALPLADPAMRDIVAYLAFISRGIPVGVVADARPPSHADGDAARGLAVYARECARCHRDDGRGQAGIPPLWGDSSFNIGAGMARLRTAATFIAHNMPLDRPGSLSERDAQDVAAYMTSRARPDFAGKEHDWPNGDPPPDVAYRTSAATRSP